MKSTYKVAIVLAFLALFVVPVGSIVNGILGNDSDKSNAVATLIAFDPAYAGKNNCPDNIDDQTPQRGKACIEHLGHWQEVSCNALPAHTTEGWPGHDWVDPVGKKNCGGGGQDPTPTQKPADPTAQPTTQPTAKPTETQPTAQPTAKPTETQPTAQPTAKPTETQPTAQPTAQPTDDDDDDGDDDKEKVVEETVVTAETSCTTVECYCLQVALDWIEEHILPLINRFLDIFEKSVNVQQDRNEIMEKWEFVAP